MIEGEMAIQVTSYTVVQGNAHVMVNGNLLVNGAPWFKFQNHVVPTTGEIGVLVDKLRIALGTHIVAKAEVLTEDFDG